MFTEDRLYQRGVWHLWGLNRLKFLQISEHHSVQVEVNRKGYYFTDYLYIFIIIHHDWQWKMALTLPCLEGKCVKESQDLRHVGELN